MPAEFVAAQRETEQVVIHALWMTAGLSCDGDSVAMTAAGNPSLEDLTRGILPGMPRVLLHHPLLSYENGGDFMQSWFDAAEGKIDPFVLLVEGSIPNERTSRDGHWAALGADPVSGQPIRTSEWIDRLAPRASAIIAVGTCATYGGIPAMKNNPTGAMGLPDYLGWGWKSRRGIPIVCVPGCPAQPDNTTETLLYVALMIAGVAPMIELDHALRPRWLFDRTVHQNCDRAAFYEHGDFAAGYGSHKCMVKLGCKGPVAKCNVGVRGWVGGRGGCPNVGGICIGCTMPGFPDKYMPFMDSAYPVRLSVKAARFTYGPILRFLRKASMKRRAQEPEWRMPSLALLSGYTPSWESAPEGGTLARTHYLAGGKEARRYELPAGEHASVEVYEKRLKLSWSSPLGVSDWIESIREFVSARGTALGLVIYRDEKLDSRGDLTWRETQALANDTSRTPMLVRVDLGNVVVFWRPPMPEREGLGEVGVIARALESELIVPLMSSSASPEVKQRSQEILQDARHGW